MRQGQQNRRGRGRGRKPQNPLSRSYESNGPDVKVRGTASHVAEKYMSLARDALSSSDIVTAESYLQHAEHYNRIVMAAQVQAAPPIAQPGEQPNGGGGRPRQHAEQGSGERPEPQTADGGTGSQDRERHIGDREHHGGSGRDRHGDNRHEGVRDANRNESVREADRSEGVPDKSEAVQDANGAEPAEVQAANESETTPDQVS